MSHERFEQDQAENPEMKEARSLAEELEAKYGDRPWLKNVLLGVFGPTLLIHEGVDKVFKKLGKKLPGAKEN